MFRQFQQRSSSRASSSMTSSTNNLPNNITAINNQKVFGLYHKESVTQKSHKRGIGTPLTHTLHNEKDEFPEEKLSHGSRTSQSVYEQYVKTLQSQIASRERERVELHKNLDHLKRQNSTIYHQLGLEKKKSSTLLIKVEQIQTALKQNEEKKRILHNQKEQMFRQCQFEAQRRKQLEANEMNFRSHLQGLQADFRNKSVDQVSTINKLAQQNNRIKQNTEKLNIQIRNLELNNDSYKKQLNQVFIQKTKVNDSLLVEKQFIENQFQNEKKNHQELRKILNQKEETIKQLNRKIIDIEKAKELDKDRLKYDLNEIRLENSNMKKNHQTSKENFKNQMEILDNEGKRLRQVIVQMEKNRKVDHFQIGELREKLEVISRQKILLLHQKQAIQQQLEKQRGTFSQQKQSLQQKIQNLQGSLHEKSRDIEQINKRFIQIQSQLQLFKHKHSTQKQLLMSEIHFLKQQMSSQSTEFSSEATKFFHQRQKIQRYYNDQLSKTRLDANEKLRKQLQSLRNEYETKLKEIKDEYEANKRAMENKIQEMKKDAEKLKQQHASNIEKLIQENQQETTRKLQVHQSNSVQAYQTMQSSLKEEIMQKSVLIKSITARNNALNLQISNLETKLDSMKRQLRVINERFEQEEELKSKFKQGEGQLREVILQQRKKAQFEKNQIRVQADRIFNELQSQINRLLSLLGNLNTEKQQILEKLSEQEEQSSILVSELKSEILTLQLQKSQLQQLMSKKEQQFLSQIEEYNREMNERAQKDEIEKSKLKEFIDSIYHSIVSVVDFAEKYSGQKIRINQVNQINLFCKEVRDTYDNCRKQCEKLTTFIGQRLYAITVLINENTQLNVQLENAKDQILKLQQNLRDFTSQNSLMDLERIKTLADLSELQRSLENTNLENNASIAELKESINAYKSQLARYEVQIQQLSIKVKQHQMQNSKSSVRISELQQEVCLYKSEIIQNLIKKHKDQVEVLKEEQKKEIISIQQKHETQKQFIKNQSQLKLSALQKDINSQVEKVRLTQKIVDKKNQQFQELQKHFNLAIERKNLQHQEKIKQYKRELQFLSNKTASSVNQELLMKKIQLLQKQIDNKQKELKVLQDNNALLRKNFINSISEQEVLRQQVKLNKSQCSSSRSRSKDSYKRDTSQQLKIKHFLRKNIRQNSINQPQSVNQMDLSSSQRSYSNSSLNNRKFEISRQVEKRLVNLNLNNIKRKQIDVPNQVSARHVQRSSPSIPLDLKRIRQRSQRFNQSQLSVRQRMANSQNQPQNQKKPQNTLSPSEATNRVTPIKDLQTRFSIITVQDWEVPESQQDSFLNI